MPKMDNRLIPSVEFVITAPEPYGAELAAKTRARMTLGVITQLVAEAERYLVMATPFIHRGAHVCCDPLWSALDSALHRGVSVDVVSTSAGLRALCAGSVGGTSRANLRLFHPKANAVDNQELGFHAKFCLADGQHAYIGSANLTGGGLHGNLEMGLLVHGDLAHQVERFWRYLVGIGFFVEITR